MKEFKYFMDAKNDKSIHTKVMYNRVISNFLDTLNIQDISNLKLISAVDIRGYIMGLNMSASSKNSHIRILKSFFSFLYKNDFIEVNQMNKIDKNKTGTKIVRMPSDSEMELIYSNCQNKTTSLMLALMSRIGLRRSELCLLKISDISPEGRIKISGKGSKEAVLKLPETLFSQIKDYVKRKNRGESEFLFSYDSHPVSTTSINMRITEYINSLEFLSPERKKVLCRPHSYRHFAGTRVYNLTHDILAVQHQLRHADSATSKIYVHVGAEQFDKLSESL